MCWAVLLCLTLGSLSAADELRPRHTSICAAQVAQEAPAHFACGCLLLTSELLKVGSRPRERSLLLGSSGQVCCHTLECVCWRYRLQLAGPGGWALAVSQLQPVCFCMFLHVQSRMRPQYLRRSSPSCVSRPFPARA